jgi:hypothetical protein
LSRRTARSSGEPATSFLLSSPRVLGTPKRFLHLGLGETEVGSVALPERSLLQKTRHALAAYLRDLIYSLAVVDEHETPGLAVEVGRCHRGDLDEQALVLGLHRVWQKGAVRGLASPEDFQELQSQPPKASIRNP